MEKEYFTVLEKVTSGQTISRVGSFTTEEVAQDLADYKNNRGLTNRFFDVVRSDLYETLEDFFGDERKTLCESAKNKLTRDEWEAVNETAKSAMEKI